MINVNNGRIYIPVTSVSECGINPDILRSSIPHVSWHPKHKCWYLFYNEPNVDAVNQLFDAGLQYVAPPVSFVYKTPPMAHQIEALDAAALRPAFAYFMSPGLGKTKVIIDEMRTLAIMDKVDSVLVVCPKSVIGTWVSELYKHGDPESMAISYWDTKDRVHLTILHKPLLSWYIINADALRGKAKRTIDYFTLTTKLAMVIDESTIIANIGSQRSQVIDEIGMLAKYRRILSGTPIANTYVDLYGQFSFLDPGIFSHRSYHAFLGRYAIMGGYKDKQVVGYRNVKELTHIVGENSFRKTAAECLDLPPRTREVREVTLGPMAKAAYKLRAGDLEKDIMWKITKLRQITGGMVIEEDGTLMDLGDDKLNELKTVLRECRGSKVIIWCQFVHEIQNILRGILELKEDICATYIDGSVPTEARMHRIKEFEEGMYDVIVLQNDAGHAGITLNAATVMVYYTNHLRPMVREQSEDRNYRKGQERPVTIIDLIVPGTVDQTILESLENKIDLSSVILEASAKKDATRINNIIYPKRREWIKK